MKKLYAAYLFAIFLCSSTQVRCSIFDNFLFGSSSDSSKGSSEPTELPRTTELSNATLSEAELVSITINSTIDEEFFDLLNASENILVVQNSSGFQENATKQSVKKQLVDIPPKPPVTWQPRPAFGKESVKTTADSSSGELNVTLSTDEPEEVVLGTTKASVLTKEKTIFQKSLEWVENTYTLSILIPVAAGVLFATTCIVTIAVCGCIRRCCRRRRLRKKIMLPDSVKSLRASDRKRLLGDCSSDEEF